MAGPYDDDIFSDDGELAIPTMRGSANLDAQDYEGYDGRSSILDDELQEDIPSTPGYNPGAASAPDVDGTEDWDMLEVPDMDAPGMKQSEYGSSPWGPGSGSGYRPYSQQRTDITLDALSGGDDAAAPQRARVEDDSMRHEPEVINTEPAEHPVPWDKEWHANQNQEPSNAEIDPGTIYDRTSYEYEGSSQDTIGSGIFGMEEGATWRARDGIFANQYALPQYIAAEDDLGVQQSEMWDSTAGEWRVTQPSASGVALARRVDAYKAPPSGIRSMRPEPTGARSHIEAFGRKAARCVLVEAGHHHPQNRSQFLNSAIESLGPGTSARVRKVADKLVDLGYPSEVALEDALAHSVMHATVKDLTQRRSRRASLLPRLDLMSKKVQRQGGAMKNAATRHLAPLLQDKGTLKKDLKSLNGSPAAHGIGQVAEEQSLAPAVAKAPLVTTRNVMVAGGVGLVGYLLYNNRKKIAKNIKKLVG